MVLLHLKVKTQQRFSSLINHNYVICQFTHLSSDLYIYKMQQTNFSLLFILIKHLTGFIPRQWLQFFGYLRPQFLISACCQEKRRRPPSAPRPHLIILITRHASDMPTRSLRGRPIKFQPLIQFDLPRVVIGIGCMYELAVCCAVCLCVNPQTLKGQNRTDRRITQLLIWHLVVQIK